MTDEEAAKLRPGQAILIAKKVHSNAEMEIYQGTVKKLVRASRGVLLDKKFNEKGYLIDHLYGGIEENGLLIDIICDFPYDHSGPGFHPEFCHLPPPIMSIAALAYDFLNQ
jgi:hypothetical protein